jgi:hypothetical protein
MALGGPVLASIQARPVNAAYWRLPVNAVPLTRLARPHRYGTVGHRVVPGFVGATFYVDHTTVEGYP